MSPVGLLWQAAPPASLTGEPLAAPSPAAAADVEAQASQLAASVVQGFRGLEALIEQLPEDTGLSEKKSLEQIAALQVSGQ